MQKAGATQPTAAAGPPFSSSSYFGGDGGGGGGNNCNPSSFNNTTNSNNPNLIQRPPSSANRSRPGTSTGEYPNGAPFENPPNRTRQPSILQKDRDRERDRRPSFGRKPSFTHPSKGEPPSALRRGSASAAVATGSSAAANDSAGALSRPPALQIVTDSEKVPPVPAGYAASAAARLYPASSRERERERDLDSAAAAAQSPLTADSFSRMMGRAAATPVNGYSANNGQLAPLPNVLAPQVSGASMFAGGAPQSEASIVHQHIQELANKRISTLDYLRKAHEGRVYWFNTLLFDKPDLARMPYFNSQKLARRATNYLFLGLSLPTVIDLNSNTPLEFLRSLNLLLSEFDTFQQLHNENGSASGSLSRARLPQMFRRSAAAATSRARRTSGATEIGYALEQVESGGGSSNRAMDGGGSIMCGGGGGSMGGANGSAAGSGAPAGSVISFAPTDPTELLPGEEYTHLLTPSLPFDPDFFETFATLCDVLIDAYQRLLGLVVTPRECSAAVAELFTKADSRVRKIIVQGVVKEFEDASRAGVKTEVANVGKVVLGGLM